MAGITTDRIRGLEVRIFIDDVEVGGQRGASLSMSADELDITDKTTENYKAYLVGLKEWNISCDGLVCTDDQGYKKLFDAFLNGDIVQVQFKQNNGTFGYKGPMVIASMDFDAQYDDAVTYSCELKGAGALSKVTE